MELLFLASFSLNIFDGSGDNPFVPSEGGGGKG